MINQGTLCVLVWHFLDFLTLKVISSDSWLHCFCTRNPQFTYFWETWTENKRMYMLKTYKYLNGLATLTAKVPWKKIIYLHLFAKFNKLESSFFNSLRFLCILFCCIITKPRLVNGLWGDSTVNSWKVHTHSHFIFITFQNIYLFYVYNSSDYISVLYL